VTDRRFCRFHGAPPAGSSDTSPLPNDGMCLSAYLIVRPDGRDREVLLGRLDPGADWARIGGLDARRVARIGRRWMLPSSQLLLFESPDDAVHRIADEQLGFSPGPVDGPRVFSEAYARPESPGDPHWDLQFVYTARWRDGALPRAPGFSELAFVDVATTPRDAIARSQADVLALAGIETAP